MSDEVGDGGFCPPARLARTNNIYVVPEWELEADRIIGERHGERHGGWPDMDNAADRYVWDGMQRLYPQLQVRMQMYAYQADRPKPKPCAPDAVSALAALRQHGRLDH